MECECCGRSLDNGVLVLPWEDGTIRRPMLSAHTAGTRTPYMDTAKTMIEGDSNQLRGI